MKQLMLGLAQTVLLHETPSGYNNSELTNYFAPIVESDSNKTIKFLSGDVFNRGNTFRWNFLNNNK